MGGKMNKTKADIGLIGLGVMGQNLALNMESHNLTLAVHNRTPESVDNFVNITAKGRNFIGCANIYDFVMAIEKPRKIMMMVKAGVVVDSFIDKLLPYLEKGDIIIDGGNSNYHDTTRRTNELESKGYYFIGAGVSGGEEGALKGPAIMPGGSVSAWDSVKDILQLISAKVDGQPCCDWIGEGGSGHFVKMVHNGIEYGDMQLICESYQIMRDVLSMSNEEMHKTFKKWNEGELGSYLIEITANILAFKDVDGEPILDKILDVAGQKGTGKWTGIAALNLGAPLTLIGESVFYRYLSSLKDERVEASKIFSGPDNFFDGNKEKALKDIHDALYGAKMVSYAQGYNLLSEAAKEYQWNLNYGGIALIWRGGCIIRSVFLNKIKDAYDNNKDIKNLLLDPFFRDKINNCQKGWRRTCSLAIKHGVPIPAMTSSLCYFDGYRNPSLPANLLQAQRDYFGAHKYERVDKPRGQTYHTDWL